MPGRYSGIGDLRTMLPANSTLTATLVPQIFLYSYRNFTKFDSGRVEGTNVMLHSLDKKEEEQNRASLKCIIDTTIFCGENEIPLRGHWATDGRKPFRKGGQFSSVARFRASSHVSDTTAIVAQSCRTHGSRIKCQGICGGWWTVAQEDAVSYVFRKRGDGLCQAHIHPASKRSGFAGSSPGGAIKYDYTRDLIASGGIPLRKLEDYH
ncbi:hypothetical protein J6590_050213 [Homalodisca vitripennis]|nr:hypothetical protein J6590_050213 [Homalodisca vitripennis]